MSAPDPIAGATPARRRILGPVLRRMPTGTPGRHLQVVPVRIPTGALPVVVATAIVLLALLALAASHAFLIRGQMELDDLDRAVAAEHEQIRRLRLDVAMLESPDRILTAARDRLGMVSPSEVGYLLPSSAMTDEDDLIRVRAAEPPPEPEPDVEAPAVSPEEAAVAAGEGQAGDPDTTDPDTDQAGREQDSTSTPAPRGGVRGDLPPPADEPAQPPSDESAEEDRAAEAPSGSDTTSGEDDSGADTTSGEEDSGPDSTSEDSGDFDLGD